MFTGLIREMADVDSLVGNFLTLKAKYKPSIGDSIAVNGICLTVVKIFDDKFTVEISPETKSVVAMESFKSKVHIEPAMKIGDRLEGHIVQGHVDCIGTIFDIKKFNNGYDFFIKVDKKFIKYIIPKGSIAIDGVSLTINSVQSDSFRLTIIPHTMKNTLFESYKIGTRVNIETDMFARYIYHLFSKQETLSWSEVDFIMSRY